jgi:hypothetical protein
MANEFGEKDNIHRDRHDSCRTIDSNGDLWQIQNKRI